jgi:hypothetical protein
MANPAFMDPQAWGAKYCEWESLESLNGHVCGARHEFNCTLAPAFVPCMRLAFHLYSVDRVQPFRVECMWSGGVHIMCPMQNYTVDAPCVVHHSFVPEPTDHKVVGCMVSTRPPQNFTCLRWKHAYIDLCQDPFDHPLTGVPLKREQMYYFPVDWTHPVIQHDMRSNPQDFAHYTPHNRHPRVQHAPHLLKNPRPKRTLRRRKELSLAHILAYAGQPGEGERPDLNNITMHDPDEPAFHEEVTHWAEYPRKQFTLDRRTEGRSHIHTVTFGPFTPPSSLPEPHHPDLRYIQSYHEYHIPVKKLRPDGRSYYNDYTELDHHNLNHPANRAWHPDEYEEVHHRQRHAFAVQKEKQDEMVRNVQRRMGSV